MKSVTTRQTCLIILFTAITFKLMFLPSLLSGATKNNAPAAIVFLGIIELIIPAILLFLSNKYPDMTFKEILGKAFGKSVAKVVLILFSIHFLLRTIAAFIGYYLYLYFTLYSDLQWLAFAVPMILVLLYVITTGLKNIGRLVEIFVPLVMIAVVFILVFASVPADLSNVLPIFADGVASATIPALDFTLWTGNFLVYIMIMGNVKRSKHHNRSVIITIVVTVMIITLFYLLYTALFSYNASNYGQSNSDMISILPQSSDVASIYWLVAVVWCIAMFLYCIVFGACSQYCIQEAVGTKYKWQIGVLICVIVLAVSVGLNFDISKLIKIGKEYGKYYDYIVQFAIPILLLIFSFRLKSDRSGAKTEEAQTPLDSRESQLQQNRKLRKPHGRSAR